MIERFQNINPEKDDAYVFVPADLKNEIQIITLPDDLWSFWERFLTKHATSKLIEPISLVPFKDIKGFNLNSMSLKREFFKHCDWFADKDYADFARHMLGKTPNRKALHPKVSVPKTKILVLDNLAHDFWVERRKRKKVVLQDLMDIKPTLQFTDAKDDVIDEAW